MFYYVNPIFFSLQHQKTFIKMEVYIFLVARKDSKRSEHNYLLGKAPEMDQKCPVGVLRVEYEKKEEKT